MKKNQTDLSKNKFFFSLFFSMVLLLGSITLVGATKVYAGSSPYCPNPTDPNMPEFECSLGSYWALILDSNGCHVYRCVIDNRPRNTLRVQVSGLNTGNLQIKNNIGGQTLAVSSSGLHDLANLLPGASYEVSIVSNPPFHSCNVVSNGSGELQEDQTAIIECMNTYAIEFDVNGLSPGAQVNLGIRDTSVYPTYLTAASSDGLYHVGTLLEGSPYQVQVSNHSDYIQTCYITDSTIRGTIDEHLRFSVECVDKFTFEDGKFHNFFLVGGIPNSWNWQVVANAGNGRYSLSSLESSNPNRDCVTVTQSTAIDQFITYDRKVSAPGSPEQNRFVFYLDGVEMSSAGGEQPWETMSHFVPAGQHTYEWCYKTNFYPPGQAWLDNIYFTPVQ